MFKVLIILIGMLNHNEVLLSLSSKVNFSNIEECNKAKDSEEVRKDIGTFTDVLKSMGYYNISIQEAKCIGEDKPA
jgi:hypothetical protein